jgi:DNA-directed RNA polymerase subunit RPC12/RpoP
MTRINILIKPFRVSEAKTVAKVFFLLGVGFLCFSGTCLLGFKDFCSEQPTVILFILLTSFALILAGESILAFSNHAAPQAAGGKLFFRWMAEPMNRPKRNTERRCAFCGTNFILPNVSRGQHETEEREFDRLMFGICLGCGKAVCPRCAYIKGFDMKLKSLHCPGCGSLVL